MRVLIFLIFLIFCSISFGQINFYKTYSGSGYDKAEGIAQLEDSSYIITGSSSSWSGNSDAFLLHLDSLGNYLWSRNFGGQESDCGNQIAERQRLGVVVGMYDFSQRVFAVSCATPD